MPLMLLGEFCRKRREGKPLDPHNLLSQVGRRPSGEGGRGGGTGWVLSERRHWRHTHFWKSIYVT